MKTPVLLAAAAAGLAWMSRKASAAPAAPVSAGASRAELEALCDRIARERSGTEPRVLASFVDVESNWQVDALNASDAGGGAWGLCQITERTALAMDDLHPTAWGALDPIRAPFVLTAHPEINLQLAASLIAENAKRCGGPPLSLRWLQDLAALYNSGRTYDNAPAVTRNTYVPRFLRAFQRRGGVA